MPSIASCEPVRALRTKFHVSELIGALLARAARRSFRRGRAGRRWRSVKATTRRANAGLTMTFPAIERVPNAI
jgi:hypothetical protein